MVYVVREGVIRILDFDNVEVELVGRVICVVIVIIVEELGLREMVWLMVI